MSDGSSGFTNKEMLIRILDKMDKTHELAVQTNGKVGLHTKILWSLGGAGFAVTIFIVGWLLRLS